MAREIREGEEALAANSHSQTELRSLLGMAVDSPKRTPTGGVQKVGLRNPVRDEVGKQKYVP